MSEPLSPKSKCLPVILLHVHGHFVMGSLLQCPRMMPFLSCGTIYGGDGRTTFGLPDLQGRVPVHAGSGSGGWVDQ